ncbi:PliI family lysozyme inhibitor of I-type lysozyme [Shewanella subflava]|uniref:PliI family lysozyme inhibitor of I-type lysozyme n=1 Tax=Shewanella subflava TaxID=2986476 RepID=A0ABT3I7P5_9GAMM|nr:PliI family lysozyme inhibitor of I-type lysozyme [Shewanella subflava]MCW3171995.1 PliI family lysozyme inhibitor of I-type lysozyme [Shewanella subflava]
MWKICNSMILAVVLVFSSSAMSAKSDMENGTDNRLTKKPLSQLDGYLQVLALKNGMSVVIEEGRLEPRSIGSISVKLYRDLDVGDFASAITFMRDGTIINTVLADTLDGGSQITITTVTAGSGQYQVIHQICIMAELVEFCKETP